MSNGGWCERTSNPAGFTPKRMKVSIIPCLTGRRRSKIVPAVPAARVQNSEILVVDDRSEEGTRAVLKEKLRRTCDRIIHYPIGKGTAFIAVSPPRRGSHPRSGCGPPIQPEDYPGLLEPLISDQAGAVFCSQFMGGRPHRAFFFWHMVATGV